MSSMASIISKYKSFQLPTLDGHCRRAMAALGHVIGKYPWPFLLSPLVLVLIFGYPFVNGILNYHTIAKTRYGSIELFTPKNSASNKAKRRIAEIFPDGGYFADRTLVSPNLLIVLVSAKDGGTVLRPHIVSAYAQLRADIENLVVSNVDGLKFDYQGLCATDIFDTHCRKDPFIAVWHTYRQNFFVMPELTFPYINVTAPIRTGFRQSLEYIGPLLGDVRTDRRGRLVQAKYVRMIFNFPPPINQTHANGLIDYAAIWTNFVQSYRSESLDITYWNPHKYSRDMSLISRRTVKLLPLLVGLLLLFALASCCMANVVLSKPWVALSGVVSASLGIMVAYAICFLCRLQLIEIAMIVPFLVLSIGVDDMFVMLNVWRRTERHLGVAERTSETFRDSAVSISITTLTDAGVFAIGTCSLFPAIRIFCTYCFVSILFVFLFQITFFGACLALEGRREAALRSSITFMKVKNPENYKCACSICERSENPKNEEKSKPWPATFFRNFYTNWIGQPVVQTAIICSYLLYLALSVFCFFQMEQGLQVSNLVPTDTDTYKYLNIYETFFSRYSTSLEVVIAQPLDYSDQVTQRQLLALIQRLENTEFTERADFWLLDFLRILTAPIRNKAEFYEFLLNQFLRTDPYFRYAADIVLIQTAAGEFVINATRFFLPLANLGFQNRSTAMHLLEERLDEGRRAGFQLYMFDVSFPLAEQYDEIAPGIVINVCVAGLSMMLIAVLFIPGVRSCLLVALTVVSINVGVVGMLAAWKVRMDIISTITILLSIGFSVDFSSHIAYHYTHARGVGGQEKLSTALETIGWPIIQSTTSTLVGVVTVIGVNAYVATTFVKTVVLVMLVGVYHGILVLPVLLTLLTDGCALCSFEHDDKYDYPTHLHNGRISRRSSSQYFKTPVSGASVSQSPRPEVSLPRVDAINSTPLGTAQKRFNRYTQQNQQTMKVKNNWLDAWLHGDIACAAPKGKYCAYCATNAELCKEIDKLKDKSLKKTPPTPEQPEGKLSPKKYADTVPELKMLLRDQWKMKGIQVYTVT